ncbi:hypothetical protein D3C87_1866010 [compost metagenome]
MVFSSPMVLSAALSFEVVSAACCSKASPICWKPSPTAAKRASSVFALLPNLASAPLMAVRSLARAPSSAVSSNSRVASSAEVNRSSGCSLRAANGLAFGFLAANSSISVPRLAGLSVTARPMR